MTDSEVSNIENKDCTSFITLDNDTETIYIKRNSNISSNTIGQISVSINRSSIEFSEYLEKILINWKYSFSGREFRVIFKGVLFFQLDEKS